MTDVLADGVDIGNTQLEIDSTATLIVRSKVVTCLGVMTTHEEGMLSTRPKNMSA